MKEIAGLMESHRGKLRKTEASKQYQGIQSVLATTNLLKSTTTIYAQSHFNTHTNVFQTFYSLNQRQTKGSEKNIYKCKRHLTCKQNSINLK